MTATTAPPRPRTSARTGGLLVVAAIAAALVFGLMVLALRGPSMVDRVVIDNRSAAPVTVRVSGSDSSSVLPLGTIGGASRLRFEEVLDQGDDWTFWLRVGSDEITPIHRTRERLERDGWRVEIPRDATSRLTPDRG
jgi:hypothetical protein